MFFQNLAVLIIGLSSQWCVNSIQLPTHQSRPTYFYQGNSIITKRLIPFGCQTHSPRIIEPQLVKHRKPTRNFVTLFQSIRPVEPTAVTSENIDSGDRTGNYTLSITSKLNLLQQENLLLRSTIKELEFENQALGSQRRIVIEKFEGEGDPTNYPWWSGDEGNFPIDAQMEGAAIEGANREVVRMGVVEECDEPDDDGTCPLEPDISFSDALRDRAYWLVGLLALQSMSGFILARNEALLQNHPVIIYFLTMLVGAGGNAGNQASVRVIRGLALGNLNDDTQRRFLNREFKMACSLSIVLSMAGFIRAVVFRTPLAETIAITLALSLIVFSSICLGAVLPLVLRKLKVDPAHSSTTIQVIMDILGVVLTVIVSGAILDSPFGQQLVTKLVGGG